VQVALMFLTRGDMPHEASWAAWLRSAEGMVPIDPAQDALCAHKPAPGKCPWANGVRQVRMTCLGTMISARWIASRRYGGAFMPGAYGDYAPSTAFT